MPAKKRTRDGESPEGPTEKTGIEGPESLEALGAKEAGASFRNNMKKVSSFLENAKPTR
jgi:hypothetical protein